MPFLALAYRSALTWINQTEIAHSRFKLRDLLTGETRFPGSCMREAALTGGLFVRALLRLRLQLAGLEERY